MTETTSGPLNITIDDERIKNHLVGLCEGAWRRR
jgi:hypothetical protein